MKGYRKLLLFASAISLLVTAPATFAQDRSARLTLPFRMGGRSGDTLLSFMDLVLGRNRFDWTDADKRQHRDSPYVGAEPTFAAVDNYTRRFSLSDDPREVLPLQLRELDRINKFYMYEYYQTPAAQRFPCRTMAYETYRRDKAANYYARVNKFAVLNGALLAVFVCRDLQTQQEFRFMFTPDPGVIEAFIQPDLASNMLTKEPLIQTVLFDTMKALGYVPDAHRGMGHVHLSKGLFQTSRHLQNFIKFLYQHSELFEGILEQDYFNARPLRMILAEGTRPSRVLWALQNDFGLSLDEIYEQLDQSFIGTTPAVHFAAEHGTVELRGNRAFANARQMNTLFLILEHVVEVTSLFHDFHYVDHGQKTPEQMIRDYFSLVGSSVDRERARELIFAGVRGVYDDAGKFLVAMPNLRELSYKIMPREKNCDTLLTANGAPAKMAHD